MSTPEAPPKDFFVRFVFAAGVAVTAFAVGKSVLFHEPPPAPSNAEVFHVAPPIPRTAPEIPDEARKQVQALVARATRLPEGSPLGAAEVAIHQGPPAPDVPLPSCADWVPLDRRSAWHCEGKHCRHWVISPHWAPETLDLAELPMAPPRPPSFGLPGPFDADLTKGPSPKTRELHSFQTQSFSKVYCAYDGPIEADPVPAERPDAPGDWMPKAPK